MSEKKFNSGDLVYDASGQAYQYVAESPSGDGHICLPCFESHDMDGAPYDWTGDPVAVRGQIYSDAVEATHKADAKLADINTQIAAARQELLQLKSSLGEEEREIRNRKERISQHEKLRLLDEYLAGKITHFVVVSEYGADVQVKTVADALKDNDRYATGMKLLTLYGDSKGDLQFRINRYSDGSGNSFSGDAYPFTSEDDAKAFAKELVAKKLQDSLSGACNGYGIPHYLTGWAKTADAYGVPVPEEWLSKLNAAKVAAAESAVAEAKKKVQEAEVTLAALKGGAV